MEQLIFDSTAKLLLFFLFVTSTGYAQCGKLKGTIIDISGKFVKQAELSGIVGNGKINLGKTNATGNYEIALPCGVIKILINAKGYRSMVVPVYSDQKLGGIFDVPFVMHTVDTQINDEPYAQSEQKHYVVRKDDKSDFSLVRSITVRDAVSGESLAAEVCLFYTQKQTKECFQLTKNEPVREKKFDEKDIVAMEITSSGYQSYQGNLILDRSDQQARAYTIHLTRQPVLFAISVVGTKTVDKCALTGAVGSLMMNRVAENQFYINLKKEEAYRVTIFPGEGKGVHKEQLISLRAGLNLKTYQLDQPGKNDLDKSKLIQFSDNQRTIYFNQSDYRLNIEACYFLDSLVLFLKANQDQRVMITGHTDNIGKSDLNLMLSEFRAKVVANYLINSGVQEKVISWSGRGGKFPKQPNDTEENKQKNRRVEIQLVGL